MQDPSLNWKEESKRTHTSIKRALWEVSLELVALVVQSGARNESKCWLVSPRAGGAVWPFLPHSAKAQALVPMTVVPESVSAESREASGLKGTRTAPQMLVQHKRAYATRPGVCQRASGRTGQHWFVHRSAATSQLATV